jgi:hypothetical protein
LEGTRENRNITYKETKKKLQKFLIRKYRVTENEKKNLFKQLEQNNVQHSEKSLLKIKVETEISIGLE